MMIDWTNESIIATACIISVFLLSAYWSGKVLRIILLLIGFVGIWLAIVDPYLQMEKDMKTTDVRDISTFLISVEADQTDSVQLFGSDYYIEELAFLSQYHIKHLDIADDFGFNELTISDVQEGKSFRINGVLRGNSGKSMSIWLETPDKRKVIGELEKNGNFVIEAVAPVKGLYEYEILAMHEDGDTISEIIPVEVLPSSKLSMLIIAASPQFEFNYLKNYWVSQGHAIVQRAKISQEKYNSTFVNMDKFQFTSLNSKVLDKFDILLVDIISWNGFTSTERGIIIKAISERGLGLILKPTQEGEVAKSLPNHRVSRFTEKDVEGTLVNFADIEYSSLWSDNQNGIVYEKGFGQVLILKTSDSYRLILNNQKKAYQKIWGDIFSTLYVKINENFNITTPFLTFQGERTEVQISYIDQDDNLSLNDDESLIINYTPFLDGFGEAKVIPKTGWNKISNTSEESQWFYAHDSLAWMTMKQMDVNRYIQKLTNETRKLKPPESYFVSKHLPFYIPVLLIILGFGMVWLMEKIT